MTRLVPRSIQAGLRFLAAVARGAGSTPTWTSPPGPERFQIGYKDGCDAGYASAGSPFYERADNPAVPEADADYQDGWRMGFYECEKSYNHFQATLHSMFGAGE